MTRWSPDTCGCVLEYGEDINHLNTVTACPKHAAFKGAAHLDAVLKHNQLKNKVRNFVAEKEGHENVVVTYDDKDDLFVKVDGAAKTKRADLVSEFGAAVSARVKMV